MTDTRRARVDALFDAALELPPDRRADFLDAHCPADPGLRADVEDLLQLTDHTFTLLDPVAGRSGLLHALLAGTEVPPQAELTANQRVGVWQVVREIGRGGMGTVYLVDRADGLFEQKGALKLVRAAVESGDDIARRLRRERRILATLTHANIARLLDGGQLDDGRPFFVMEYVEGLPIDRYCDERRLTIDGRLELFLQVGAGIHHAHRRLVVHRDVKPSNIIVTPDGDVKLLDFGIARILAPADPCDDGALTQPLTQMLTPEYASPEQVRGEPVAIASDVYQLGLLLYELLAGMKAHTIAAASPAALEHAICEIAPVRPSERAASASQEAAAARHLSSAALARRLAGDLDTIVLCALRKEPDRRYASVAELLDDVQRYRTGRPVKARADSVSYRAHKFVVRHRAALVWSAAIIVIAGISLPAIAGQRLRTAREAARAERIEQLLADVFALPNPRLAAQPPTAVHYADHAARLVRTELHGQPRSQARLLTRVGRLYNALGHYGRSIDVLDEALALRRASFGGDSIEAADTLEWLGQSQHYLGLYDEAESTVRQALAIRQLRLGPENPDTIRTMLELGDLLHTRGRLLDAERILRPAVAALRSAARAARAEDLGHDSLPRALRDLANVLRDRGVMDESAALFRDAIAIFRELHGEPNQQIATSQIYFARLLIMRSEFDAAERLLAQAIPALRRIYEAEHSLVGMGLRELGHLRIEQGRFEEAAAALDEAERIQRRTLGDGHSMVPRTRAHQAELARRRGRLPDAVHIANETLAAFEGLAMPDHPAAVDTRLTLVEALRALGQHDAAARELDRALAIAARQFRNGDARLARIRSLVRDVDRGVLERR